MSRGAMLFGVTMLGGLMLVGAAFLPLGGGDDGDNPEPSPVVVGDALGRKFSTMRVETVKNLRDVAGRKLASVRARVEAYNELDAASERSADADWRTELATAMKAGDDALIELAKKVEAEE